MNHTRLYAFILSLLVGFISLSSEILWVRVVSYAFKTLPQAFSLVLIVFLSGIALGSWYGKDFCKNKQNDLYKISFLILVISSVTDILFLYIALTVNNVYLITIFFLAIFFSAFLKSMIFPIAHHLGTTSNTVGSSVSFIYFGNIIGSTLGPIVTGFFLLEYFNTINTFIVLSVLSIFITIFSYLLIKTKKNIDIIAIMISIGIIILFYNILENKNISLLISKKSSIYSIENRHGIIDIFEDDKKNKIVYGSGMYDGAINYSLYNDINMIKRAYRIAAFDNPLENILMIGLSSASWLKVISTIPTIKKITVIEINPGYLELLKKYEFKDLLTNKDINFIYDDGRRWLKRNPNNKFDAIVMNTTWHFRNNISNLISKDFLKLSKQRLIEDGFIYYNSTDSIEAFKTATTVYKNVYRYLNFIIASDSNVILQKKLARNKILMMKEEKNKNIFDKNNIEDIKIIDKLLNIPLENFEQASKKEEKDILIITDEDPINEYKRGYFHYKEKIKNR